MGFLVGAAAAYSAYSSYSAGADAKSAGRQNQAINNASADDAINREAWTETLYRRKLARVVGNQRNEIGARNVEASGTALRLLEDTSQLGQEDIVTMRNNAAREAWGYKVAGKNAATQGGNQQAAYNATALTSAAKAFGTWYNNA